MEITTNIFYIAIGSLSLIIIGLAGWLIHIQNRLKKMLLGKNAESLEDSIRSLSDGLKEQQDFTEEMEKYLTTVEHRLKNSIQSVETIRYNPFKGTGSGGR
jgi:biopolymer transport protein ExbB/TolQ